MYDLELAEKAFDKHFDDEKSLKEYLETVDIETEPARTFLNHQEKIWRKEHVIEDGHEMFREVWEDVTDNYIDTVNECLKPANKENRFSCGYVANVLTNEFGESLPDKFNHQVIFLHGGRNGGGDWLSYIDDIDEIFHELSRKFETVYLIKTDVDVVDDVFYMWIGVQ